MFRSGSDQLACTIHMDVPVVHQLFLKDSALPEVAGQGIQEYGSIYVMIALSLLRFNANSRLGKNQKIFHQSNMMTCRSSSHALLTYLICSHCLIVASLPSKIFPRQDSCTSEAWICPNLDGVWGVLQGIFNNSPGVGGLQGIPPELPNDGKVNDDWKLPETGNRQPPVMSPVTDPIEINVLSSPDQAQCEARSPPSSNSKLDSVSSSFL